MIFFSILVLCTICEPSRMTLKGTVDDVFTDEIDSQTSYLSLKTPSTRYYCSIPTEVLQTIGVETLIDAECGCPAPTERKVPDNAVTWIGFSPFHPPPTSRS